MLHGKKGFDRLIYACENVFSKPFMWLFCNVSTKGENDGSKASKLANAD